MLRILNWNLCNCLWFHVNSCNHVLLNTDLLTFWSLAFHYCFILVSTEKLFNCSDLKISLSNLHLFWLIVYAVSHLVCCFPSLIIFQNLLWMTIKELLMNFNEFWNIQEFLKYFQILKWDITNSNSVKVNAIKWEKSGRWRLWVHKGGMWWW